jgi:predicted transcriptional regulator
MPSDNTIDFSFLLAPEWRQRLERVAEVCNSSPREFVREAIEAEIVKREILLEQQGDLDAYWSALAIVSASLRLY